MHEYEQIILCVADSPKSLFALIFRSIFCFSKIHLSLSVLQEMKFHLVVPKNKKIKLTVYRTTCSFHNIAELIKFYVILVSSNKIETK